MIRVILPAHLQALTRTGDEVCLEVAGPITQATILDALETRYPPLRGTLRDHETHRRRPFIRFFACGRDLSHEDPQAAVPEAVAQGVEPYLVVGAMAGG